MNKHALPALPAVALRGLLCTGLLAATLPAAASPIDSVSNDYLQMQLAGPDDTFLISSVHQKAGTAWIRGDLRTSAPDRIIRVHWTDHRGQTMLNFDGVGVGLDFKTWITLDAEWVGLFSTSPRRACSRSRPTSRAGNWSGCPATRASATPSTWTG